MFRSAAFIVVFMASSVSSFAHHGAGTFDLSKSVTFTGEPNIPGAWAPEQVVMVDPRGTGGGLVPLSQLSQLKPGDRPAGAGGGRRGAGAAPGPRLYGGTELTELGQQAAAAFAQKDNP